MRLIVSNDDARELDALMTANPDADLEFAVSEAEAERSEATVIYAGRMFKGKMRRTPSAPGGFVIEDFDGRRIAEGVADDEGERP